MGNPRSNYSDPIQGAINEIISAVSSLNMEPSPSAKKEYGTWLSESDTNVAHSIEHLREALNQLEKLTAVRIKIQSLNRQLDTALEA